MYSKKVFWKIGGFDEKLHWGEGNDLLKRAAKKNIELTFTRNPKYTYSFRRMRKQGTFKTLRNVAQIELVRLTHHKLPIKLSENLYPMEGGTYFEIGEKEKNRIAKFFFKILKATQSKIENGNHNFVSYIFKKIFPKLLTSKNQKRVSNQSLPK